MPTLSISVRTCLRPTAKPSSLSMSRNMRAPANGKCKCSSSIRRINTRSVSATGRGRGSTRSSAREPAARLAASAGAYASSRSFLCARTVDATERAGQKIILQRQLANLRLHVLDARTVGFPLLGRGQEHPHRPVQQLRLPLHDLTGMDVELLGELRQSLVTLERGQ